MQNFGGQTKTVMVFLKVAYRKKVFEFDSVLLYSLCL